MPRTVVYPALLVVISFLLLSPATAQTANPEPAGWYAGDMHVHRSCGGSPVSVPNIYSSMSAQNLSAVSLLADMGNGEVQTPTTDLPLVNGQDASISTPGRIVHWDAEWHWDATYTQFPHQALGGHLVGLGLTEAHQIWQEYTSPIFDWAHQQNGIMGFAHMQYLDNSFPTTLTCCTPIEYPVEIGLGSADFISEDVNGSESATDAYYRLLNSGFRPGFAAGTDYPCNDGVTIGSPLTYVRVADGQMSYRNWIDGISNGRTVVSRNGHNEFVDLKVNGSAGPGDQIDLTGGGTLQVSAQWTANQNLSGTIELLSNGVVVASKQTSVTAGTPATLTASVNFPKSGWVVARRTGNNGHVVHTAAVFVIVDGLPVRANATDPQFYTQWMNSLLTNTSAGGSWNKFFPTSLAAAQTRYRAAKAVYEQITREAQGSGPALSSITVTPSGASIPPGKAQQFIATGVYSDNSTVNLTGQVTWASSNPGVATVNPRGLVAGVNTGSTVITATFGRTTGSTSALVQPSALAISTQSLPDGTVNVAYSTTLAASGGTSPYSWSISGGTLPGGLTLNTTTGVMSGTPTASGNFSFTVQVQDSSGPVQTATKTLSLAVVGGGSGGGPCPCTIWPATTLPALADSGPDSAVELGVKFRADSNGYVNAIRFYKGSGNTGTHVGHLWSSTGTLLATATFTNETGSGWQQVDLSPPIAVTANTVYVASYHTNVGHYSDDISYFTTAHDAPPLHVPVNGGVYAYAASGVFPSESWNASNYWVDVVFMSGTADTTPPSVVAVAPSAGAYGIDTRTTVSATFNEALDASTVTATSFVLLDSANAAVQASVSYDASTYTATLKPASTLSYSSTYRATIKAGMIKDRAGNALTSDYSWSFTTAAQPPVPPNEGPGGPILVVSNSVNPFSRYYTEILRAEGFNEFTAMDISLVTGSTLSAYDVVILGDFALTSAQASMFTTWVNGGGNLIAMHPDGQLASLLGIQDSGTKLAEAYLAVNTARAPGTGIVGDAIQFHGEAQRYTLNGATSLATLYSNATTATNNPAVTLMSIGSGQAAAFTYDLARSVVYTRQGNPAWSGQERDGSSPIRSDDLFFGAGQPDWVDFNKITIPQADEQQRLLANLIMQMNQGKKPLPRFWYLPRMLKAAVVMTGDDHGNNGTAGRFDNQIAASAAGCSVDNWQCVRSTSYLFPGTPLSDSAAAGYRQQGFEVALHVTTNCTDWASMANLDSLYTTQIASWKSQFPSLALPVTNRTHCITWSDYDSQPQVELSHGIRFDANYYYWPGSWVQDRPGMFTGSGMPMRFAKRDGALIDVYQATTQLTDESDQSYPQHINTLLDNALGAPGYYGVFTANMHTDAADSGGSDAIIASAQARGVPVVSAAQMLTWLDGRNGSSFANLAWQNGTLTFDIVVGAGANGLQALLPTNASSGALTSLSRNGAPISYTTQTIKGMSYAVFAASPGSYAAQYVSGPTLSVTSVSLNPTSVTAGATSTGTVTLSGTATSAVTVALGSSDPAASVPATAIVDAGSSSATFAVTTSPVTAPKTVTISASYANSTSSANLTITPVVTLSSASLNPSSVTGGNPSTGTATLNIPSGTDTTISLQSSDASVATVPSTVTVLAGSTSVTFQVGTVSTSSVRTVTISASFEGTTKTATLTVNPQPTLASVALNPTTVTGGSSSTATVTLSAAADSNFVIALQSSDVTAATVPATVTIGTGATSASFAVTTLATTSAKTVTISATYGAVTKTAELAVNPVVLSSISLSPTTVVGGNSSTATVRISQAAPTGGATVSLFSSNSAAATVPSSVTVTAGNAAVTFTVATSAVGTSTAVSISASLNGTRSATLTVNPPSLSSLALSPTAVTGGSPSTGTVTLSGVAPRGGLTVTLGSNNAAASVPGNVTVTEGSRTATFTISTSPVASNRSVTISASYSGTTRTATLTVRAPTLQSLSLSPTTVKGGNSSTGTVTLNGPAPSTGVVVSLTSNRTFATVPASVTLASGKTTATFTVRTSTVSSTRTATISGTLGSVTRSATLTATP